MTDIKLEWPGEKPPEEDKEKDWLSHVNPLIGMEKVFSLMGAGITRPIRDPKGWLTTGALPVYRAALTKDDPFLEEYEEWKRRYGIFDD